MANRLSLSSLRLSPAARALLSLSLAATVMAGPSMPAAAQAPPMWLVLIKVVTPPPGVMCVGEVAPVAVVISIQPPGGKPTSPPLVPPSAFALTAEAKLGTVTPARGTWWVAGPGGSPQGFTYKATKEGKESITIRASYGSVSATTTALPLTIAKCQYDIGLVASSESKTDQWWWLVNMDGSGTFGVSEGSALAGKGSYQYNVDGLWKAKTEALRCRLPKPVKGSSSFEVSGTSIEGGLMVTLAFADSQIPATDYKCVDKEGKESEKQMWGSTTYNPQQELSGITDMLFTRQGGEWPITFGSDGEGAVYITRRQR